MAGRAGAEGEEVTSLTFPRCGLFWPVCRYIGVEDYSITAL